MLGPALGFEECKFCGSKVSKRKLEAHVERVHKGGKEEKVGRPPLPLSEASRAVKLLERSPRVGLEYMEKLESKYASDAQLSFGAGVALLRLDSLKDAQEHFQRAVALDRKNELAKLSLTLTTKALEFLSPNRRGTEKDLDRMGEIVSWASDLGAFTIALRMGNIMLQLDKDKARTLNNLGLIYCQMGNYEKAVEYLDMALMAQPEMPEALGNKALCTLRMGRVDEAYALYISALRVKPNFLQAWYHLGYIEMQRGNDDEDALRHFDRALELNDEYYLAWHAKGQLLKRMGRSDEAKLCLLKATELNPEFVAKVKQGGRKGQVAYRSEMRAKEGTSASS